MATGLLRAPDRRGTPPGYARRNQEMPTGLGHYDAGALGSLAGRPQGAVLSVWEDAGADLAGAGEELRRSRAACSQRSNSTSVSGRARNSDIAFGRRFKRFRIVPHRPPIIAHSHVWQTPFGKTISRERRTLRQARAGSGRRSPRHVEAAARKGYRRTRTGGAYRLMRWLRSHPERFPA